MMFNAAMSFIRRGLAKLRLLKSLEKVTDYEGITQNEVMFDYISMWRQLYHGYYKEFHELQYFTLDGYKKRDMETLNIEKVIANEMASLIYNENCKINISDERIQAFVDEVFRDNKFDKNFQENLEYMFAMGGMAIKPYVDNDKIRLSFIKADSIIPLSWRNGMIYEYLLPNTYQERGRSFTHLEIHKWKNEDIYEVRHELYEANPHVKDEIGVKVGLSQSVVTESLAPVTQITGINRSIPVYFKPNIANNKDMDSPLGISLYANALSTIKQLDTAFDSLHREFRLGKKRIIVPSQFITTVTNPLTNETARYFDTSDESYESYPSDTTDTNKITDISVELRIEEHIQAINFLLNILASQTGFSQGAFSFDGAESVKTATEVISQNSKTFKSKKSHENIIEEGLRELIGSIVTLAELYGILPDVPEYEVNIKFDDSVTEDIDKDIDRQIKIASSGLQPMYLAIMNIHKISEEEAKQMLNEIKAEQRATLTQDQLQTATFGTLEY